LFAGPSAGYVPDPFRVADPAAVPVLVSLLKHENLRCRQFAIGALPRMSKSPERIIRPIIDAARDPASGVCTEAASVLGRIAGPKEIGGIVHELLTGEDDQRCLWLFDLFLRSYATAKVEQGNDQEADPLADGLDDALHGDEPDVARRAGNIFDWISPHAATLARITKALRQGDPQSRAKATKEFLSYRAELSAIPGLIVLLREKDISTRRKAANAMLQLLVPGNLQRKNNVYPYPFLSPRVVLRELMELALTDDTECRREAAEAFLRLGGDAAPAVPALIAMLRSKDKLTQQTAIRALFGLELRAQPAIPALLEILAHEPPRYTEPRAPTDIRSEYYGGRGRQNQAEIGARDVLAAIGSPAVPALVEALNRPERQARLAAAETLRLIQEAKAAIPGVIGALDDDDPLVRTEVVHTLGVLALRPYGDNGKLIAALIMSLSDKDRDVRNWAIAALGAQELDCHSAVLALIDGTRSPDAQMRDLAAGALRSMCANGNRFLSPAQRTFNDMFWRSQPVAMVVLTALEMVQWDNVQGPVQYLVIYPARRRQFIRLLGKIGTEARRAIPVLTEALQDSELYDAATEALEKINAKAPAHGKEP
jgi:HEAT repeat protein